ncbi:MAG: hypothetical protein HON53_03720 [Planctomycetaceae bacterium]|jgi:hypothetical protein|nr:hypothetical protein [Planctomycetaceae bacterium]MBT6157138.1 hypothetical protein [Planctomycetaceae bacterium]MBT6483636.1 hypothetical protein [Planctomycetaceae bacterium]MBT6494963.1 hypothetical protein [Planctomycetaceae bacterium]
MSVPETSIPPEEYEQFGSETYVTDALVEKYHTAEGAAGFRRWSMQATQLLVRGQSVYFPADYERWIAAGLPDGLPGD